MYIDDLLTCCIASGQMVSDGRSAELQKEQVPSTSRVSPARSSSQVSVCSDPDWAVKFFIRWEKLSASVLSLLKAHKRLSPSDKNKVIKFLVDEMKKCCPNPDFSQSRIIARQVVAAYPNSFEDRTDDGERLGDGYYSLAKKIKTRIEYTNRGKLETRLRQKRKSNRGGPEGVTTVRAATQYGCMQLQWQPVSLPANETEETLAAKVVSLQQLASHGPVVAQQEVHRIDADMTATYIIQRRLINSTPPVAIETIKSEWPFLFFDRWLFRHFECLVGKSPYTTLREALAVKGPRILAYFGSHGDSNERDIVGVYHQSSLDFSGDEQQNALTAAVLCLVMQHFKEKENSLIWRADVSMLVLFYPYY